MGRKRPTQADSTIPRKPERVLTLDVSSVCVGFATFEGKRLTSRHGRYVQVGKEHGERLANFSEWLLAQFKQIKPQQVVVEMPYSGRRRFAFGVLMMYFGVVIATYFQWLGVEMPKENRVQASAVKRRLKMEKGSSHADRKHMMVDKINELYGLSLKYKANDKYKAVSEDDVADAIALGRAWLIQQGLESAGE